MTNEDFLCCLSICFEHLLVTLQRSDKVHRFVCSFVEAASKSIEGGGGLGFCGESDCCDSDGDTQLDPSGASLASSRANSKSFRYSGSGSGVNDGQSSGLGSASAGLVTGSEGRVSIGQTQADITSSASSSGSNLDINNSSSSNSSNNNTTTSSTSSSARSSSSSSGDRDRFMAIRTVEDRETLLALSRSCKTASCELAQKSLTQLISLRRDANAKLGVDKMKALWEAAQHFISSMEGLSGVTAYEIRQCLMTQTKKFLDYLHEAEKNKLVHQPYSINSNPNASLTLTFHTLNFQLNKLDNEKWVQFDVDPDRQRALDRLTSGKAFLPRSKEGKDRTDNHASHDGANGSEIASSSSSPSSLSSSSSSSVSACTSASPSSSSIPAVTGEARRSKETRSAEIRGSGGTHTQRFRVVYSVILLVEIFLQYLDLALNFPEVTTEIISKVVELLRLFDSRTKQLVLGTQAIKSAARLKNISAKHLAITSQSVGLLLALLPHIRTALLVQLPPKQHMLLTELDRVSHGLIDHHNQLLAKLVSLMGDFVDASSVKLKTVDWDRFQGQCAYFEEVLKNFSALHSVLQKTLPPEQVHFSSCQSLPISLSLYLSIYLSLLSFSSLTLNPYTHAYTYNTFRCKTYSAVSLVS